MNAVVEPKSYEAKLPAAVIRNAQVAEEMQQNLINPPSDDPPPGDPPLDPNAPPPADPPLDPNAPPVPPVDPVDESTWKHKFNSMQGRYNADVGRLRGQVETLSGQVASLNNLLGAVRAAPAEETFRPAPPAKPRVTPEEVAEYGEDFVDFASRLAAQEISKATAPLLQEINNLKQQVGGVGETLHQNDRDKLISDLDTQLPGWRDINRNQEYLDWLSLTDPYTGAIRQDILNEAYEQNNFPRVAAFFKGFLAELAATANPPKGVEPENKGISVPKIALNAIVAPGRAKSAAATPPSAPPEKPIYTPAAVTKFFNDKIAGKFKGREADAAALEADIILAGNEGRIR